MSSPFSVFRKHQKVLLVVLVGLSMLSFVIFDAIQNVSNMGDMPPQLMVLTLAALVGAVAWVAGITNHKSSEYGLFGLVVGAALGAIIALQGRQTDVAVTTAEFTFANNDLRALIRSRSIANSFVAQAIAESHPEIPPEQLSFFAQMSQFGFGLPPDRLERDVVLGELLRREGEKLGIRLPDTAVQEFISLLTQDSLTRESFRKIRNQLEVSERELMECLRKELLAREAAELLFPRVPLPPAVEWEFSKRLQVRQNATVAAVPTSAFLDPDAKPPAGELEQLFTRHRENFPGFDPLGRRVEGLPGFRQPPRIRMAYVTPDFLAFERQVEPTITEEMILARYEQDYVNPAKVRDGAFIPEAPSLSPRGPMLIPPSGPSLTPPFIPDAPAPTTPGPTSSEPGTPPPSSTNPPPDGAPPPETSPPGDAPPATDSSEKSEKDAPATPEQGSNCDDPPAAPETPAAAPVDPPAGLPELTAPFPVEPRHPEVTSPPGAAPRGAPEMPPLPPASSVPPLDDELKSDIRDQLLMELTHAAVEKALADALEEVRNRIGRFVNPPPGAEMVLTIDEATKRVRAYAESHHLVYSETSEVTQRELLESDDHRVGSFTQPRPDNPFRSMTVAEDLFSSPANYLFRPRQIEEREPGGRVRDRAIYWKLDHQPGYVPNDLSEPRVRTQVERAWRELAARQKAEARAQALADKARQSGQPLLEALGSETVTGAADGPPLNITQTGQFAWMRQTMVPSMNMRQIDYIPEQTQIPGLEPVGEDFMRIAFDALQPGDVGVAPSAERTVFYVLRVDSRIPADDEQWNIVRNNYLSGVFDQAQQRMAAGLVQSEMPNWRDELYRKYQVIFREDEDFE